MECKLPFFLVKQTQTFIGNGCDCLAMIINVLPFIDMKTVCFTNATSPHPLKHHLNLPEMHARLFQRAAALQGPASIRKMLSTSLHAVRSPKRVGATAWRPTLPRQYSALLSFPLYPPCIAFFSLSLSKASFMTPASVLFTQLATPLHVL